MTSPGSRGIVARGVRRSFGDGPGGARRHASKRIRVASPDWSDRTARARPPCCSCSRRCSHRTPARSAVGGIDPVDDPQSARAHPRLDAGRARRLGFALTALETLTVTARLYGMPHPVASARAVTLLAQVGLTDLAIGARARLLARAEAAARPCPRARARPACSAAGRACFGPGPAGPDRPSRAAAPLRGRGSHDPRVQPRALRARGGHRRRGLPRGAARPSTPDRVAAAAQSSRSGASGIADAAPARSGGIRRIGASGVDPARVVLIDRQDVTRGVRFGGGGGCGPARPAWMPGIARRGVRSRRTGSLERHVPSTSRRADGGAPHERPQRIGTLIRLELTQRVRSVAWYVLLGVFFVLILVVTAAGFRRRSAFNPRAAARASTRSSSSSSLLLAVLVSPTLSGNAINGDRDAATLAPDPGDARDDGRDPVREVPGGVDHRLGIHRRRGAVPGRRHGRGRGSRRTLLVSLVVLIVEIGVIAGIGVGLSGILARPLFSVAVDVPGRRGAGRGHAHRLRTRRIRDQVRIGPPYRTIVYDEGILRPTGVRSLAERAGAAASRLRGRDGRADLHVRSSGRPTRTTPRGSTGSGGSSPRTRSSCSPTRRRRPSENGYPVDLFGQIKSGRAIRAAATRPGFLVGRMRSQTAAARGTSPTAEEVVDSRHAELVRRACDPARAGRGSALVGVGPHAHARATSSAWHAHRVSRPSPDGLPLDHFASS